MKKGLISVVVPIYNLAEFLPKCLDSLLNQTFLNYEIILVDDGSMDESPSMCDKYAELYEKVSVVHKKTVDYLLPEMQEFLLLKESILFFLIRTTGLRRIICLLCMKCNLIIMRI